MTDFTPIKQANLRPHDLAKLVGVGRVTASVWLNDHHQPHPVLRTRVDEVIGRVQKAMDLGFLPVPHTVSQRGRWQYVEDAIAKADAAN